MLAEAIHSFADSGNQGLLLWGMRQAKRPPSPDYPLGWGKAVFFWSFIVALVLFSLGGLFSLYEGWHKLHEPEPLKYAWVAVGILVFGLVAETISLRACLHEVNKVRGERTLWRWFRESRQSELVVILGEDLAALLGLALALAAVLLTILTGRPHVGRARLDVDRRGADRRRHRHRHRDQGAAHRPERRARDRGAPARVPAEAAGVEQIYRLITLQLGTSLMVAVKAKNPATYRARAGRDDQPRRSGDARRVSRGPVALFRARYRRLMLRG